MNRKKLEREWEMALRSLLRLQRFLDLRGPEFVIAKEIDLLQYRIRRLKVAFQAKI